MENSPSLKTQDLNEIKEFQKITKVVGVLTENFIYNFYPYYQYSYNYLKELSENDLLEDSYYLLNSKKYFSFYRICECKIYNVEDKFEYFAKKMQKLFTTAHSMKKEICYGIVSDKKNVSIVIGISKSDETTEKIIKGLFSGIKLEEYTKGFSNNKNNSNNQKNNEKDEKERYLGCICGIPALKIDGEYQNKDLAPLIRSLNGQNYTIMALCKPVSKNEIQQKINDAVNIHDKCFTISKRTLSLQKGVSDGNSQTETEGTFNATAVSGGLSFLASASVSKSYGKSESFSETISKTISENKSISGEIQNGFAIEIMKMAETMIERLKIGRNIGMWESIVSYSSDSETVRDIIQGHLYSEIASGLPEVLPPSQFSYKDNGNQQLIIPKGFIGESYNKDNKLSSLITSEELCSICSIPIENTEGFEIQESKNYALNYIRKPNDKKLGYVSEYDRPLDNVPFGFSEDDLNKHTFVCGITGSGKTNTVMKILENVDKPFLIIEPAKREYRNIKKDPKVYTLGRPEINCIKMNPFYVPAGISLQQHIDLLKDLFTASFSFYGPMPYILEKCLYRVYEKRGWNLTLGLHSYYTKESKNISSIFDESKMKDFYNKSSHKYIFPNIYDLKKEITNYIDKEMTYEGEVKGNIKSALQARIESLCVGAKGYMFNTNEHLDFETVFNKNSVFELEGLADDSDKAFALGLIIIYLNEYRQVCKDLDGSAGLKHLLVIEEAHRLLKNVSSENNEFTGNPKGKAIEHFTNMLAEMRSYGQGVIVAEQIPTKLAPDVIKNSSNKVIHRIVAKDDQETIANTIGIYDKDAIYIGNSKVGYALCHKEGMVQPVMVKIDEIEKNNISDYKLYQENSEKIMFDINKSVMKSELNEKIESFGVKALISLMYEPNKEDLKSACEKIEGEISKENIKLAPDSHSNSHLNIKNCIRLCIYESIIDLLISGKFSNNKLPSDKFVSLIEKIIQNDGFNDKDLNELKEEFRSFYNREPSNRAIETIAILYFKEYKQGGENVVKKLIKDYIFNEKNIACPSKIENEVKKYLEKFK